MVEADLKLLREELELTQEQMSLLVGLNRGLYSMAESGKRTLSTATLTLIYQLIERLKHIEPVVVTEEWLKSQLPEGEDFEKEITQLKERIKQIDEAYDKEVSNYTNNQKVLQLVAELKLEDWNKTYTAGLDILEGLIKSSTNMINAKQMLLLHIEKMALENKLLLLLRINRDI